MKIHPTAIVGSQARLGESVEIGAYAIVEDGVTVGEGCTIQAHAVLTNRVTMGAGNFVGYGCVIGGAPQDFAHNEGIASEVVIGDGNTFREYVTIHRGTKEGTATVVGDNCYLMVSSHLGHNVKVGNQVVIANACHLAGYVEVGDRAVLGGGTVFHQFMRVGTFAMVRGGTRFGKDIPPYAMGDEDNILAGMNSVGLRRGGFTAEERLEIKRAYKVIYGSGLNVSQAMEEAAKHEWGAKTQVFLDFIRTSKRGICPMAKRKGQTEDGEAEG